jgi:hypothetical protein
MVGVRRATSSRWKPRVLFQISNTFGYDAQEPVIRALVERRRADVAAAGGIERGVARERIDALAAIGVPHHSLNSARHRHFEAVVLTDIPLVRYWRSGPRLYLHHGSGFATRDSHYAFDLMESGAAGLLLALHETEVARGLDRFGLPLGARAAVVGQPKLDRLIALGAGSGRETLASLGLDPARLTVIVMSHWSPTSVMESCGMEILRLLERRRDLNILVTGHYLLWNAPGGGSAPTQWRSRLAWVVDAPHMRLLPASDDLAALMAAADIAITDHTSATLEYAALYRPIVLFRNPAHPFTEPDIDDRLRRSSSVFTGIADFSAALEEALTARACDRARRAELLDSCFRFLGESARRTAMAVEQVAWNGAFDAADSV